MRYKKTIQRLVLVIILGFAGLKLISLIPQPSVHWNRKVYVAFGFHGNLYHSFRGDTNDEKGFGQDIRVIRHVIRTLDRFNNDGVKVRGTWDFDNHFSLEDLLPRYAPDILRDIRRRVARGKDEVLLMSYNNGLASAMTRRELADSVGWAISNPWGSGVKDVFGTYTPVVRPQEMMTSPGNFKIYREAGVKAVSLYYSATPFDTFRLFTRELTPEEAYNPLTYENDRTGEKILIIPSYNIGDLVEHTSLGHWVERLHRMQREGKINRDVLVFINFDADSEYWTGAAQLKWPLNRLPNTRGLEGLIREVKDKHYVRFTTLKDYLADHGPAGSVRFRQDTADGSFDGYNSWSEKKGSTDSWTRIMAARRLYEGAEKAMARYPELKARIRPLMDEAYLVRLKAMSTTNFGMATPFLAPEREAVMGKILDHLDLLGGQIRKNIEVVLAARDSGEASLPKGWKGICPLLVVRPGGSASSASRFLGLPRMPLEEVLSENPKARFYLRRSGGEAFPLIRLPGIGDDIRFYISGPVPAPDGTYLLCTGPVPKDTPGQASALTDGEGGLLMNRVLSLALDREGKLTDLKWKGDGVAGPGSLYPWFTYRGVRIEPAALDISAVPGQSGTATLAVGGTWNGPEGQTVSQGSVRYWYTLLPELPYLFVTGDIRYPTTASTDVMKADVAGLSRRMDMGWQETAPVEFRLLDRACRVSPVRIFKTNYTDTDSAYDLNYFRHSPENLSLDNVNNQITPGMVGVRAGNTGLALGFDQSLAANFAGVPMRVSHDPKTDLFSVSVNPFGTYYGKQNRRPTRGNGLGREATLITGEQFHSAGPTYNGRHSRFSLMLGFFSGDGMPAAVAADLKAYANPAVVFLAAGKDAADNGSPPPPAPVEVKVSIDSGRVTFSWTPVKGKDAEYAVRMGRNPGRYPHVFRTRGHSLTLEGLTPHHPFARGQQVYAVIDAAAPGWGLPVRTPEICLDILDANHISARAKIPWRFPLKVIWDNIRAAVF